MPDTPQPLLFTDPCFLDHQTGDHPESPARLQAISRRLAGAAVTARFDRGTIRQATTAELERVHTPRHVAEMQRLCAQAPGRIEADTVVSAQSYRVALQAAGSALSAVDAALGEQPRRALCLARPPGHHAVADGPMGFCLFNNVAVAAAHARAQHHLERVLVVDFDVHHGNGTQDIFYESGHVHFVSVHRSPFYPGTGAAHETGRGAGQGCIFNLPLKFGTPRREFLARFERLLTDAATKCRPQLVLLSAGFDAHAADPVGSLGLESEDYQPLTRLVVDVAKQHCAGRLVSLLEGGYNVDKLAECIEIHMQELLAG